MTKTIKEKPIFGNDFDSEYLKDNLIKAFQELDGILINHSGPFAANCVIGSRWRQRNDIDEFTKDGIKILSHLVVSEDPVARFTARMTRGIGITVDNRCHDGTTTSMLLFCRLAIHALTKMNSPILSNEAYRWGLEYKAVLTYILLFLENIKITDEDIFQRCQEADIKTTIADVRAAMGYHMAMISSKGDHELSSKIAYIIKSTPKKIHGMFGNSPISVETEEPYILKHQKWDIAVNASIGNLSDYNYKNDTQYLSEDTVIFATANDIVTNSFETMFLTAFISKNPRIRMDLEPMFGVSKGWEDFHEGRRHLIIMTPLLNDSKLIEEILIFNKENPHAKITWFNTQITGRMKTSFIKTLNYMSGVPLFQDCIGSALDSLIGLQRRDVKVEFIGYSLMITKLYEKDGSVYHPYYDDPEEFESYTLFRKETEELLEFAMENVANPILDQEELTYMAYLYRTLCVQDIYDIQIGGSIHDQHANKTVYEDAMGSALSAVSDGVVLSGHAHIKKFCEDSEYLNSFGLYGKVFSDIPDYNERDDILINMKDDLVSIIADAFRKTDREIENLDEWDYLESKWDFIAIDPNKFEDGKYQVFNGTLNEDTISEFLEMKPGRPFLLQSYAGYHEQFKRFRDILPRLANTACLADMRAKEGEDFR